MSSSAIQSAASTRSNSGLRYAHYVGRVGALAVSLGVGFAVAATPGVAHADESTDSTSTSTSTDDATTTNASPSTVAGSASTAARQNRRIERNRVLRVFGMTPGALSRHTVGVRPPASGRSDEQTNNNVQNDAGDNPVSGDNVAVVEDGTATDGATPTTRPLKERKSANDVVRQLINPRRAAAERPVQRAVSQAPKPAAAVKADVEETVAESRPSVQASVTSITTTVNTLSAGVTQRAVNRPTVAVAPTTPVVRTPVVRPAALVTGFLAAVGLVPTLTPPTTPAPAPTTFVWAVLAFVRREIEQAQRTFLNRTPHAVNDAVKTSEQTSITFDPRLNDRDDDTLKITGLDTTGTHGTVTTDGKTITYTPNADTNSLAAGQTVTDTFTYTVSDADSRSHLHGFFGLFDRGHTGTATVTVTITGVNDAPTVVDDEYSINGTTTVTRSVLANDSDVDGDRLTAALVSGNDPNKGTLAFNSDGTFTYTPKAGFSGTDSFTYEASDGDLKTPGIVTITANAAPVLEASVDDDVDPVTGQVTVRFSYSDSAADTLTVNRPSSTNFRQVGGAGIGFNDDVIQKFSSVGFYEPTPEARLAAANGGPTEETWTFTVSDGSSTTTRTVTVPISPANAPVTGISVGEPDSTDGAVTVDVGFIQKAGAEMAPVIVSGPGGDDVELDSWVIDSDGTTQTVVVRYRYTPDPDARTAASNGTGPRWESVTFTVDGRSYSIDVPIDPAPAVVTGVVVDTDGSLDDPIDVDVSLGGDRGIVVGGDGEVTVIERDGDGWSVDFGVGVDLGGSRGGVAVDEDSAYLGGRYDDGGGRVTVIDMNTRDVTEVAGLRDRGLDRVTDVAIDRRAGAGRDSGVWVADADGTLVEIDRNTREVRRSIETRELQARGSAVDESSRSVLAVAPGSSRVYVATGGRITAVKTRERATARGVADDGGLAVDRAIDVDGEVTALEVSADGNRLYATVVGTASGRAELVEYDARTLERVRKLDVGADARALAISDDGNRAYVTTGREVSVVDLQGLVKVRDLDTGSATGVAFVPGTDTILVTNPATNSVAVVSNPYRAPTVANADSARTGEDNSVVIDVLANDTDAGGAALTPTVVSGPANGTVTLNEDGTFRYTPNADYSGTDTFTYTVTGGTSNAAPTKVTVTVNKAINVSLSWGEEPDGAPRDLDAHLLGPNAGGGDPFHVFFSNRTYEVDSAGLAEVGAFLNADDTDWAGPEVIEINTRTPGEYLYYVDNYSRDGDFGTSGATVTVVDPASGLSRTFTAPSGSGRYWSVFKMTVSADGTVALTALNHLSDNAPTLPDSTPETAINA